MARDSWQVLEHVSKEEDGEKIVFLESVACKYPRSTFEITARRSSLPRRYLSYQPFLPPPALPPIPPCLRRVRSFLCLFCLRCGVWLIGVGSGNEDGGRGERETSRGAQGSLVCVARGACWLQVFSNLFKMRSNTYDFVCPFKNVKRIFKVPSGMGSKPGPTTPHSPPLRFLLPYFRTLCQRTPATLALCPRGMG